MKFCPTRFAPVLIHCYLPTAHGSAAAKPRKLALRLIVWMSFTSMNFLVALKKKNNQCKFSASTESYSNTETHKAAVDIETRTIQSEEVYLF